MAIQTYQPKRFRRSKRQRARTIRRIRNFLCIIALFFVITTSLDHFDTTPRWGRVSFLPYAVPEQPYAVDVACRGLGQNATVYAKMAVRGANGRSLGGVETSQHASEFGKSGYASFTFTVPDDPNAVSLGFLVWCRDDPNGVKNEARQEIKSDSIPILSLDHETVLRAHYVPAWQNVLAHAFENGFWRDKRGDPTVVGWAITLGYVLVAGLCLYCTGLFDSRRSVPISQMYTWFWWLMVAVLIALGINKQLDVQLLLADIGRSYTKYHGWYRQRMPVQIRVLALGACVGLMCLQVVGHRIRRSPKSLWCALWGVVFLGVNVLMHLVSVHSIEHFLASSVAGLSVGNGLEILAMCWIAVSAIVYNRTEREEVNYIIQ